MTHAVPAPALGAPGSFSPDSLDVLRPRVAGLDVHKMQVTTTVRLCDPGAERPLRATREFSALPAGLRAMTDWVLSHGVTAAAMEGTGIFWKAPYEALEEAGLEVELFHAQHVRQIRGRKTDRNDSIWLARVCQYGLATPSYVPPKPFRDLRQTSRYRRTLTADRSRLKNRLHKALDHCGLRLGGALTDILGLNGRRILDGLVVGRTAEQILPTLSGHVRRKRELLEQVLEARPDAYSLFRLRDLLQRIDAVDRSLADVDELLALSLQPWEDRLRLLETVPGIDRGSACAILIELGPDLGAFRTASHLAAWAGVAPGNHKSAGKRLKRGARKGNPMLKTTLAECALGAARTQGTQFHSYHKARRAAGRYKQATLATAHKMLRIIYAMLRDNKPYRDPGVDYEKLLVQRNAPRWLRKLKQHGFLEERSPGEGPSAS